MVRVSQHLFSFGNRYHREVLQVYGVEAARRSIVHEIKAVFEYYAVTVDIRHLGLIADFMTQQGEYRPMNRYGIVHSSSPFLRMSFETTVAFLTRAAVERDRDLLTSPSSRLVLGMVPAVGTGMFDLLVPLPAQAQTAR
jgi:DNA-directed RNA polymerase I subunit RPA1